MRWTFKKIDTFVDMLSIIYLKNIQNNSKARKLTELANRVLSSKQNYVHYTRECGTNTHWSVEFKGTVC